MPPAPAGFIAQSGQRRGNFVDTSESCCGNLQLPALVLQPVFSCERSEAQQRGGLCLAVAEEPPFDSTEQPTLPSIPPINSNLNLCT